MFGTQVLDKDGISAGAIISEMASYLYSQGTTVSQKLDELYVRYVVFLYCPKHETLKRHRNETLKRHRYARYSSRPRTRRTRSAHA